MSKSEVLEMIEDEQNGLSPAEWEPLLAKECQRRRAEIESGEVECIPGEVVFERLSQRSEARRDFDFHP